MPATTAKQAFTVWSAAVGVGGQSPGHVLLAEHYVMHAVLGAMETEAEAMVVGGELRPEFWRAVAAFNTQFVHHCHRAKEEEHLLPALAVHGLLDARQAASVREEHQAGKELTLDLQAGVGEADWEKVMRLVAIYVHILRPHMRREEAGIFESAAGLPAAAQVSLRQAFDEVDRRVLGLAGRAHFVAIARRLVECTGGVDVLAAAPA